MGDAVGRDVLLEAPAIEGVIAARGAPPSNLEVLLEWYSGRPQDTLPSNNGSWPSPEDDRRGFGDNCWFMSSGLENGLKLCWFVEKYGR